MRIEVVTLFPGLIADALRHGVLARAIERGLLSVGTEDPRAHTRDVHRTVDDRPYGGGPGMVLKPEPLCAAIVAARARLPEGSVRIALSAQGEPLTQRRVAELARLPGMVLIAGRYEGIDERALALAVDQELSIGDYVLSGGELPALVLMDALARLLRPGRWVMNARASRIRSATACSTGRTTPGRKCMRDGGCPRCSVPAITPRSSAGGASRASGARGCGGRN